MSAHRPPSWGAKFLWDQCAKDLGQPVFMVPLGIGAPSYLLFRTMYPSPSRGPPALPPAACIALSKTPYPLRAGFHCCTTQNGVYKDSSTFTQHPLPGCL